MLLRGFRNEPNSIPSPGAVDKSGLEPDDLPGLSEARKPTFNVIVKEEEEDEDDEEDMVDRGWVWGEHYQFHSNVRSIVLKAQLWSKFSLSLFCVSFISCSINITL